MSSPLRDRAPFIWTPDQPADHAAYGAMMHGGTHRRSDGENRWYFLRRVFDLPAAPETCTMQLTVDGRYRLAINGDFIGIGPARSSPIYKRVDTHNVACHLKRGRNVIALVVYVPGRDLAHYEAQRGSWQPVFGDGGLWAVIDGVAAGQTFEITSDAGWKIRSADCWAQEAPLQGWGQGHIEILDGGLIPTGWEAAEFDDTDWPDAVEMVAEGNVADRAIGRNAIQPFPLLRPSGIPPLRQDLISPDAVFWTGGVRNRPEASLADQSFAVERIDAPEAIQAEGNGCKLIATDDIAAAMVFAFEYHTGMPRLEIEAAGGEIIDIAASERLPGELSGEGPGPLKHVGPHPPTHLVRYIAGPGVQVIEKFDWTAIRALQVIVRNAPKGVIVRAVSSRRVAYPAEEIGAFECSDTLLNVLWEKGVNTARWCMHDAWEDCPSRERRQWIADASMAFEVGAAAFGPSVYPLQRAMIEEAVLAQRADGFFQMFAPGDHGHTGVVIPDFSLHFICSLAKYLLIAGDNETVEQAMHAVERCLHAFSRYVGEHGLLSDMPEWHFIEWAHVGRQGEAGPLNALFAKALMDAAELAGQLDRPRLAERWSVQASAVIDSLCQRHWNAERGLYVDEVDPASGEQGGRVSQHMNAMMVAFGFAPLERCASILENITRDGVARITAAPPIVTESQRFDPAAHVVAVNTLFAHILHDALDRIGRFDLAVENIRANYRPMLEAPTRTLWESYDDRASLCHVFSASPISQLSRKILGVTPLSRGFSDIAVRVRTADFEWARGSVPTPEGPVRVAWQRDKDIITLELETPKGVSPRSVEVEGFSLRDREQGVYRFAATDRTTAGLQS